MLDKPGISQETKPATVVTVEQAIETQAKAQGVNPTLAQEIAFCESTSRQFTDDGAVLRGRVDRRDIGLFQINEKYHLERSKELDFNIYTSEGNIGYAMWLLKHEGNRHWNASRACWAA